MPSFVIISSGSEITGGRSLDTNAKWIANELFLLGWQVQKFVVLPDDPNRIYSELNALLENSKQEPTFVIMTGGLGPTEDDYTLETVLKLTDKKSYTVEKAKIRLLRIYESRGKKYEDIIPTVLRQTEVPENSFVLDNSVGIASGFIESIGANFGLACLPGVPREMTEMFSKRLVPELKRRFPRENLNIEIRWLWGIGESLFQSEFIENNRDIISKGIEWGVTANRGYIKVIFISKIKSILDEILSKLNSKYSHIISEDVFQSVHSELIKQKKTVAVGESCTSGLLGKKFTEFPGSSAYFLGGFLTYHNNLKVNLLGVKEETIANFGAVSYETAIEMVNGVHERAGSDFSISITGIAGPEGGTKEKPVGTVWIGVKESGSGPIAEKFEFPGDRDTIRENAANTAIHMLYKLLLKVEL